MEKKLNSKQKNIWRHVSLVQSDGYDMTFNYISTRVMPKPALKHRHPDEAPAQSAQSDRGPKSTFTSVSTGKQCVSVCLLYQAHLGLDTVQIYTGDHLQGDGVLTRLHVVNLKKNEKQHGGVKTG